MPLSGQKIRPCSSACDTALQNVSRIAVRYAVLGLHWFRSLFGLAVYWVGKLNWLNYFFPIAGLLLWVFVSYLFFFSAKAVLTLGHSRVVGRALPPLLRQHLLGETQDYVAGCGMGSEAFNWLRCPRQQCCIIGVHQCKWMIQVFILLNEKQTAN